MLRIIAGKYRNLKLKQPDNQITRATTDKVREAVFSSLQFKIQDANCLDLFSGSGAWSIEAMSRGANYVDAIEINKNAYKIIQDNINYVKETGIKTWNIDALFFLEKTTNQYDFIFIDAPYKKTNLVNQALNLIEQKNLLQEDGEIIIETDQFKEINLPTSFEIYKHKKYGKIDILYVFKTSN
ncbi:16S rRNA (guanine(966)-N(2))-methyltransferase RsmD [Mycoplasmopsis gallopavonis]|uniref:Methyltransferase n=1 Tax=Mycoplasmopsis gallopavonis TaxID=76629 RepID=A0A449AZ65_9BACT|nr:16S rRNA (guanine(966)-N(2))-methyltransferase RsmD [Mycoplasmopsis gallopavonis]RIV16969.1 16S rRNA (guanine(966)-N(2))-methyltransferase RsmD [Mycoplasmopsis gallopavonis]VEU72782.1 Putative methyltransferase [Mycoplasmopsis gallopavonis]